MSEPTDPAAFTAWGREVVRAAAELLVGRIPESQQPRVGSPGDVRTAPLGYAARYVHFTNPDFPESLAVWLFAVVAGHPYGFPGPEDRLAVGLKHDADEELDVDRWRLRLGPTPFTWRSHVDRRYAGYRLTLDARLDVPAPAAAAALADAAERALARARLLAPG